MISKVWFIKNKLVVAISLFCAVFILVHLWKPSLFYNEDGSFKQFGVGYRDKTVISIWVFSLVLGVLCYLFAYWLAVNGLPI